jgi:hypothetical protein
LKNAVGVEKDIRICSRFRWLMKTHPKKTKTKSAGLMRVSVTFSSGSNSRRRRRRRIQPCCIGWHWRDTGNTQPQNHEEKGRKKYEGEERERHIHTQTPHS